MAMWQRWPKRAGSRQLAPQICLCPPKKNRSSHLTASSSGRLVTTASVVAGAALQFTSEGAVEDGGQQRVEFCGALHLKTSQMFCLHLESTQLRENSILLR